MQAFGILLQELAIVLGNRLLYFSFHCQFLEVLLFLLLDVLHFTLLKFFLYVFVSIEEFVKF